MIRATTFLSVLGLAVLVGAVNASSAEIWPKPLAAKSDVRFELLIRNGQVRVVYLSRSRIERLRAARLARAMRGLSARGH